MIECYFIENEPHPGGSVVSISDSRLDCCELETRLRQIFLLAYFRLSPLLKHVTKVVGDFGKKFVTGVTKPGNTCVSPTAMI